MLLLTFIFIFILLFFVPDISYAWGPFTHLKLGLDILHHLQSIPSETAFLISQYPYHFLYGTISADVIIWKNKVEYSKHCHNWDVAFALVQSSYTPYLAAFSQGYLSHLAGDVIAHNLYVPVQMVKRYPEIRGKHLLWESVYDREIDGTLWNVVKKIKKAVDRECDELLEKHLKRAFFSFKTNKRIFSSILLLHRTMNWRKKIDSFSKGILSESEREHFYIESRKAVLSVLKHGKKSPYVKIDPTGIRRIKEAESIRKRLKNLSENQKTELEKTLSTLVL